MYHGILVTSDFLSEAERDVLRWGGNAKTATPDRCSVVLLFRRTLLCLVFTRQRSVPYTLPDIDRSKACCGLCMGAFIG